MNDRQKRFAEFYATTLNATEAAKSAGYSPKTARSQGQRLLTNVDIIKYIKELQENLANTRIASLTQIKAFWSDIMNNTTNKTSDRLKASEMLAKSAGAFIPKGVFDSTEDEIFDSTLEDVVICLPPINDEGKYNIK